MGAPYLRPMRSTYTLVVMSSLPPSPISKLSFAVDIPPVGSPKLLVFGRPRSLAEEELGGGKVIRERLRLPA